MSILSFTLFHKQQQQKQTITTHLMKTQQSLKLFKRKTSSIRLPPCKQRLNEEVRTINQSAKFLSPKNITGLDRQFYKREQSLVRELQEEVNLLKKQVKSLKEQKQSYFQENCYLKKIVLQHSERQKSSQNQQFATENALNQLKEKIQLMSEDDELSTYDENYNGDICNCQTYESSIKIMKGKIKFLEQSVLHSQEIIIKMQGQNRKLKENRCKIEQKIRRKLYSGEKRLSLDSKNGKYQMSSIKQTRQDGEDQQQRVF